MDVYVVIDQVRDEPGQVLGAAADLASAQAIGEERAGQGTPWIFVEQAGWHTRDAGAGWQEIVRVPLAGHLEEVPIERTPFGRGIPALISQSEITEIGRLFGAP